MTTFLAVLGVNRRLSSLMQLLLPLFFITLMTCALAFSGGVQSSQTGPVILPSFLIYLFRTLHWFTWSTGHNFQQNIRLEYYRIVHHTTCIAAGLNIFIFGSMISCMYICMHVFPTTDSSGIAERGANFRGPLMSGEMQLNGQAATVLQHRQKTKHTYRRQLSEFNGKA
jgi:hypothetical protein